MCALVRWEFQFSGQSATAIPTDSLDHRTASIERFAGSDGKEKSINQCTFLDQSNNEITFVISFYLLDLTQSERKRRRFSCCCDEEFISSPNMEPGHESNEKVQAEKFLVERKRLSTQPTKWFLHPF